MLPKCVFLPTTYEVAQWDTLLEHLPRWVADKSNSPHVAGRYLHLFVRGRTYIAEPGDWFIKAPDGLPWHVPKALFDTMVTAIAA